MKNHLWNSKITGPFLKLTTITGDFWKITGDFSRKFFITGDFSKSFHIQKLSVILFLHVKNYNFLMWKDFEKSHVIFLKKKITLKNHQWFSRNHRWFLSISTKSPVIFVVFNKITGDFWISPVIFQNHRWCNKNHRWFSGFKRWFWEIWGYFIKSPVILDNHRWFHKITS